MANRLWVGNTLVRSIMANRLWFLPGRVISNQPRPQMRSSTKAGSATLGFRGTLAGEVG